MPKSCIILHCHWILVLATSICNLMCCFHQFQGSYLALKVNALSAIDAFLCQKYSQLGTVWYLLHEGICEGMC